MKKLLTTTLILGNLVVAPTIFAQSETFFKILPIGGKCHGISANGQWVVSTESRETGFLYNDATGEGINLKTDDTPFCEANGVSNDGTVVGHVADQPAYYKDGKWHLLDMPGDFTTGECRRISADGSVIYGNVFSSMYYLPVIWRNGVPEMMSTPAKDLFNKLPAGGFILDNVSWSGDRIAGRVIDSDYRWYTVLWNDGTPEYIHPELFKQDNGRPNTFEMMPGSFSPNGRYLALDLVDFEMAGGIKHPNIYDIENDIMLPLDGDLVCFADDEGRAFSCAPAGVLVRTCYVHESDVVYTLEDWMMKNYSLDIMAEGNIDGSGTPMVISADNQYIAGFCTEGYDIKNYLMKLGDKSENSITENFIKKPVVIGGRSQISVSAQSGDNITVCDISGRIVRNVTLSEDNQVIPLESGSYIIKVRTIENAYSYKMIIND